MHENTFTFMQRTENVVGIFAATPAIQSYVKAKIADKNAVSSSKILAILHALQEKVRKAEEQEFNAMHAGEPSELYCQCLAALPSYIYVFTTKHLEELHPYLTSQRKAFKEKTDLPLAYEHVRILTMNGQYPKFATDAEVELQSLLNMMVAKNETARESLAKTTAKEQNVVRRVLGPEGSKMIKHNNDYRLAYRATAALKRAGLDDKWNAKKFTNFLYNQGLFYRVECTSPNAKSKHLYHPYPFMQRFVAIKCVPGQRIQWWFEDTFPLIAEMLRTRIVPDDLQSNANLYRKIDGDTAAECDKHDLWQLYI